MDDLILVLAVFILGGTVGAVLMAIIASAGQGDDHVGRCAECLQLVYEDEPHTVCHVKCPPMLEPDVESMEMNPVA